jgi:hypothetical protein
MSDCFEVSYSITKCSSELEGYEATNLPTGGNWQAEKIFGAAHVDIEFGTEFSIHSVQFIAQGVKRVQILLQARKGERGNWLAASATPQTFGISSQATLAYDGGLPTDSGECKRYLKVRAQMPTEPCERSPPAVRAHALTPTIPMMRPIAPLRPRRRVGGRVSTSHLWRPSRSGAGCGLPYGLPRASPASSASVSSR